MQAGTPSISIGTLTSWITTRFEPSTVTRFVVAGGVLQQDPSVLAVLVKRRAVRDGRHGDGRRYGHGGGDEDAGHSSAP